jgi:hypothetical protein
MVNLEFTFPGGRRLAKWQPGSAMNVKAGRITGGTQIISSPVKPLLAWERLQPGEGEDTAALRLPRRIPRSPRFS